jgi:hypothetical protein
MLRALLNGGRAPSDQRPESTLCRIHPFNRRRSSSARLRQSGKMTSFDSGQFDREGSKGTEPLDGQTPKAWHEVENFGLPSTRAANDEVTPPTQAAGCREVSRSSTRWGPQVRWHRAFGLQLAATSGSGTDVLLTVPSDHYKLSDRKLHAPYSFAAGTNDRAGSGFAPNGAGRLFENGGSAGNPATS